MLTNCPAYTKVFVNKQLNTVRILSTFDTSRRNKHGDIVVTAQNAVFASGDVASMLDSVASRQVAVQRTLAIVREVMRTDRIVLV
jgi:NADH dehydrogenase FAD-containing subunit